MIRIPPLLLCLICSAALADEPTKTLVVPDDQAWAYDDWHFSPAVRVGDMVWLSGQAADLDEDYEDGVRRLFESLRATLRAAGADLDDVVEIVTYHVDIARLPDFGSVHHEFFPDHYPAWTAVGVTALADPSLDLEVKVTAVVGSGEVVNKVSAVNGR